MLLEQPAEIGDIEPDQPLVFERDEELRLAGAAGGEPLGPALGQKRGLPTPGARR
jgi:hypothetical protein